MVGLEVGGCSKFWICVATWVFVRLLCLDVWRSGPGIAFVYATRRALAVTLIALVVDCDLRIKV